MKKTGLTITTVLAVTLMLVPMAFAKGAGKGAGASYHGHGFAQRTCYDSENANRGGERIGTCRMIETGEPMEISGTVAEISTQGQGLKVDTGDAVVTVYGIGPVRYWRDAELARPTVGEEIAVNAVEVTFSDGSSKVIATDMTVSGDTIDLRDDAGLPLWRGGSSQRIQKRE